MPIGSPTHQPYHPATIPALIRVTWKNGSSIEAHTCEEIEARIQELQSFYYHFWDNTHFRTMMAQQALIDSEGEVELEIDGDSRDWLQEMERGGFFNVAFIFDTEPGQHWMTEQEAYEEIYDLPQQASIEGHGGSQT